MSRASTKVRAHCEEAGFTLLETLVALTLFAIVSAAMIPAFSSQITFNKRAELRSGAFQAAQAALEQLRRVSPDTLPLNGEQDQDVLVGGKEYLVTIRFCSPNTYCTSRSRQLTAIVRFRDEELYEVSTVFTRLR